jgi:hypothetical protein
VQCDLRLRGPSCWNFRVWVSIVQIWGAGCPFDVFGTQACGGGRGPCFHKSTIYIRHVSSELSTTESLVTLLSHSTTIHDDDDDDDDFSAVLSSSSPFGRLVCDV